MYFKFFSKLKIISFVFAGVFLFSVELNGEVPSECLEWFKSSKIEPGTGKKCVWSCVAYPMDMGTFYCASHCDELCNRKVEEKDDRYFKGAEYALCRDEYIAAVRYPRSVSSVKEARFKSLEATKKYFQVNRADDESDAFRHFSWAALIAMNEGPKIAQSFLEAHESCVTEDVSQEMDRHNNAAGIQAVEKLKAEKRLSEDNIFKEGLSMIEDKKLVVISPRRRSK